MRHAVPALSLVVLAGLTMAWPAKAVEPRLTTRAGDGGFLLRSVMGRPMQGRFNSVEGRWIAQADGRLRLAIAMPAAEVDMPRHPRYTRMLRGADFFDSARHPHITFLSDPVDGDWPMHGGLLAGELVIRGVSRRERVRVEAGGCASPRSAACVIHASGKLRRGDFGMRKFRGVVGEHVEFDLRVPMEPMS